MEPTRSTAAGRVFDGPARWTTLGGAALGLLALLRLVGGSPATFILGLWLLLPFVAAYWGLRRRPSGGARTGALVAANASAGLLYLGLAVPLHRVSSTAGLAFVFIPLWQLLLVGAGLLPGLRGRTRK